MYKDEAKDTSGEGLPPSPGQPGLLQLSRHSLCLDFEPGTVFDTELT